LVSVSLCGLAQASTFYFDADADATGATGGTGVWDTTSSLWRIDSSTGAVGPWVNGNANEAVLGGTPGVLTLADAVGITVESVVVDDDVAVQDSTYTAGRRGVGATVLVEKIAGAAADQGRNLSDVADVARHVNADSRSMGVALTSCTVPAVGHPTFELSDTEIEVGIGIHGEPGRQRMPMQPARAVAELMLDPVLADLDFSGDDGVILFVNSMGATPLIELYVMYSEFAAILDKAGVRIVRSLVGPYITSLDMAGCSVTLLRADDELLRLWDHPVSTPALRRGC